MVAFRNGSSYGVVPGTQLYCNLLYEYHLLWHCFASDSLDVFTFSERESIVQIGEKSSVYKDKSCTLYHFACSQLHSNISVQLTEKILSKCPRQSL